MLLCVGPERFRQAITGNWRENGERVLFVPEEHPHSPAAIARLEARCRAAHGKPKAVLLLAPRRCAPQKVLPGPMIAGVPVGLMLANGPEDLTAWIKGRSRKAKSRVGIMAMWRRSFLVLGSRFHRWLEKGGYPEVEDWFATEMNCREVCRRIAVGARLVLYVGHGRSEGLSAYLGLRWRDIAAERKFESCGAMICFACDTVKRDSDLPFGCRMVFSGRALSYFGSTDAVKLRANAQLASIAGQEFAAGRVHTLADLVRQMDAVTQSSSRLRSAREALQTFRIIGNPLEQFG
ncbi:MAG TPA: hypothetical protein VNW97_02510 [Candidatus Saccharimonadales bacterium]|jgi:hypothetical protein|nr:hypothetical protein [Candidatus Saccharimonadales bacterium]